MNKFNQNVNDKYKIINNIYYTYSIVSKQTKIFNLNSLCYHKKNFQLTFKRS